MRAVSVLKLFFKDGHAVKGLDGEAAVFVDHIGLGISLLGERDRAGIDVVILIAKGGDSEHVSVSVKEYLTAA